MHLVSTGEKEHGAAASWEARQKDAIFPQLQIFGRKDDGCLKF